MRLLNFAIKKISGKESFHLDERICFFYLIRLAFRYALMIVRGFLIALPYKKINKAIMVGPRCHLYCMKEMEFGANVRLEKGVLIDALSTNGVRLGNGVKLGHHSRIECTGSIQNIGKGICIGDNTVFGDNCFFGAAGGIDIGSDVLAGQFIRFHSENHVFSDLNKLIKEQGVTHEGIRIGNNCWIGSGAVFLDGASIGNGCVVAANSVVTKKFDDNVIIGGVPAKVIRRRDESINY